MRRLALALALIAGLTVMPTTSTAAPSPAAPVASALHIVQFRPGVGSAIQADVVRGLGISITRSYRSAINGFAAILNDSQVQALTNNPNVLSVEPNYSMSIDLEQTGPASWGLDRIDQATGTDSKYTYPNNPGAGVDVYVFDTGINLDLADLSGRIDTSKARTVVGNSYVDCNGHGTHVSATIAGTSFGVAKLAKIVPIRVLDCNGSGSLDGLLQAIDQVISDHGNSKAVANMSLGFGTDVTSVRAAVQNLANDGILLAAAAGNSGRDACTNSPGNAPVAVTVGATDRTDTRASWSNYGTCVDIFAPGVDIVSGWIGATDASNTISGTSMASPHVAGVAAVFLGMSSSTALNTSAIVTEITSKLVTVGTKNVVKSALNSPNLMLFIQSNPPATATAPVFQTISSALNSKTSVTLTWSYSAYPAISQTIRVVTGTSVSTLNVSPSARSATINGLKSGTTYTFSVVGTNSVGSTTASTFQTLSR